MKNNAEFLLAVKDRYGKSAAEKCEDGIRWLSDEENDITQDQLEEFLAKIDEYSAKLIGRNKISKKQASDFKARLMMAWIKKEENNIDNILRYFEEEGILKESDFGQAAAIIMTWISKPGNNFTNRDGTVFKAQEMFDFFLNREIFRKMDQFEKGPIFLAWLEKWQNNLLNQNGNAYTAEQFLELLQDDRLKQIINTDQIKDVLLLWVTKPQNNLRYEQVLLLLSGNFPNVLLTEDEKTRLCKSYIKRRTPDILNENKQEILQSLENGLLSYVSAEDKTALLVKWLKIEENNFKIIELLQLIESNKLNSDLNKDNKDKVIATWFEKKENQDIKPLKEDEMGDGYPIVRILNYVSDPQIARNILFDIVRSRPEYKENDQYFDLRQNQRLDLIKRIIDFRLDYIAQPKVDSKSDEVHSENDEIDPENAGPTNLKFVKRSRGAIVTYEFTKEALNIVTGGNIIEKDKYGQVTSGRSASDKDLIDVKFDVIMQWLAKEENSLGDETKLFYLLKNDSFLKRLTPLQQGSVIFTWLKRDGNNFKKTPFHPVQNDKFYLMKKIDLYKRIDILSVWINKVENNIEPEELETIFARGGFLDEQEKLDENKARVYGSQREYIASVWKKKNPNRPIQTKPLNQYSKEEFIKALTRGGEFYPQNSYTKRSIVCSWLNQNNLDLGDLVLLMKREGLASLDPAQRRDIFSAWLKKTENSLNGIYELTDLFLEDGVLVKLSSEEKWSLFLVYLAKENSKITYRDLENLFGENGIFVAIDQDKIFSALCKLQKTNHPFTEDQLMELISKNGLFANSSISRKCELVHSFVQRHDISAQALIQVVSDDILSEPTDAVHALAIFEEWFAKNNDFKNEDWRNLKNVNPYFAKILKSSRKQQTLNKIESNGYSLQPAELFEMLKEDGVLSNLKPYEKYKLVEKWLRVSDNHISFDELSKTFQEREVLSSLDAEHRFFIILGWLNKAPENRFSIEEYPQIFSDMSFEQRELIEKSLRDKEYQRKEREDESEVPIVTSAAARALQFEKARADQKYLAETRVGRNEDKKKDPQPQRDHPPVIEENAILLAKRLVASVKNLQEAIALLSEGGELYNLTGHWKSDFFLELIARDDVVIKLEEIINLLSEGGVLNSIYSHKTHNANYKYQLISKWFDKEENNFDYATLAMLLKRGSILFSLADIYKNNLLLKWQEKAGNYFTAAQLIGKDSILSELDGFLKTNFLGQWLEKAGNNIETQQFLSLFSKKGLLTDASKSDRSRLILKWIEKDKNNLNGDELFELMKATNIDANDCMKIFRRCFKKDGNNCSGEQILKLFGKNGPLYGQTQSGDYISDWIQEEGNNFFNDQIISLFSKDGALYNDKLSRKVNLINVWRAKPERNNFLSSTQIVDAFKEGGCLAALEQYDKLNLIGECIERDADSNFTSEQIVELVNVNNAKENVKRNVLPQDSRNIIKKWLNKSAGNVLSEEQLSKLSNLGGALFHSPQTAAARGTAQGMVEKDEKQV